MPALRSLANLLTSAGYALPTGSADPIITAVTADSRKVSPGSLFVAISGDAVDGHRFISTAIHNGAVAVVGTQLLPEIGVPYLPVTDSRRALAYLSAAFYDFPARKLTVIGVTGTDGKTTTSSIIYRILQAAGYRVGMISTVNAYIGDQIVDTGFHVTTPDAPDIQAYLAQMVAAGITHAILEATSHGLHQQRVEACEFDLAVVTNIQHEHLDYHGSYENYRAAKARLFQMLFETQPKPQGNPRLAVLNLDDQSYPFLREIANASFITYGFTSGAELQATAISHPPAGTEFLLQLRGKPAMLETTLIGDFNISNILAALAVTVVGLGVDLEIARTAIAGFSGVPGRMEVINLGQPFSAIVDFAHTPNALAQALLTVRQRTSGRVITVFGSAGLRDKLKRRMMAETAANLADVIIFTAEDPRTEDLDGILSEMAAGAQSQGAVEGKDFFRVGDRRAALRLALNLAQPGDVVIACGKGHEQSMCFGVTEYPWDDRTALRSALAAYLGISGPEMPFLPT